MSKHALLCTRSGGDAQLWQQLIASEDPDRRYEAVSMTLGLVGSLRAEQLDVMEQVRSRIIDAEPKVAARAIEVGEMLQPDMLEQQAEALVQMLSSADMEPEVTRAVLTAIEKCEKALSMLVQSGTENGLTIVVARLSS